MNIIRTKELVKKIGLSRSTIWRLEMAGKLPARIRLTEKSVGYDEAAIDAWLAARGQSAQ